MLLSTQLVPANPSSGVIIADYTILLWSRLPTCVAGYGCLTWCYIYVFVRVSLYLQPHRSPGTESGGYPADHVGLHRQWTHIYTSTHAHLDTHRELWAPWQFHSWEQWRPHCRDPENTPQLPDRKAQIVNGDHTHFPIFKGSLFSTSLPHL